MTGTTPSNKTSKGKEKDTGTPRFSSRIASKSGGSGSYASKFAQSIADKSNTGDIKSKVPPADPTQEDSISGGHVETSESSTSRLSTTVVSLTADPKASSTTPTDNSNGVDPSRNGFTSSASEGGGLIPPSTGNGQDGTLDDLKIPSIPPAGHGSISSPTGATGSTVTEVPQVSSNISGPTVPYPVPANPLVLGGHLQHVDGTSNFQWGYVQGPHGLSLVPYPVTTTPPMVPSMPSTISSMGDIYDGVEVLIGDYRDIAQVNAIESNDGQPSIRELDWARKVMIMHVGHYSNVVPNLYEAHASKSGTLSMTIEPYNNVDFMGCLLPLYEDLYDDAVIYPKDSDMINHGL
ncbi:hypothetical protein FOL47_011126 [Perkinsus chesapeaki]|uniref:Uncharacterized protein n=1 Tax=Perkinsus chesapeaki TaxID=330153 RepID=A0A7J6KYH3_PERCH|nr:hypothetical protein FOL47_011126 [Perkinsus chesapeaki]